MKIRYAFILIIFSAVSGFGQPVNWDSTSHWKLYKVSSSVDQLFHRDSLPFYKAEPLNQDTVLGYLSGTTPIEKARSEGAAWMGDYWASCEYREHLKLLRLSRYGGFFEDEDSGTYYEIPLAKRTSWHLFLTLEFQTFFKPRN